MAHPWRRHVLLPSTCHWSVTSSEQGLPHLHCHRSDLTQAAVWWRFHRCSFGFIARGQSLSWGPWLSGYHIFLPFFHSGPWVLGVCGGAVEVSVGARHPNVTCSLCLGHLWLSVMVLVCRLVPSIGNLISILLNKNLLVELFDHMVDANFNSWKNSHWFPQHCTQAFFHVLPNSAHLSDRCAITLTLVLICISLMISSVGNNAWSPFFMSLERCLFKSIAFLLSQCSISKCVCQGEGRGGSFN